MTDSSPEFPTGLIMVIGDIRKDNKTIKEIYALANETDQAKRTVMVNGKPFLLTTEADFVFYAVYLESLYNNKTIGQPIKVAHVSAEGFNWVY